MRCERFAKHHNLGSNIEKPLTGSPQMRRNANNNPYLVVQTHSHPHPHPHPYPTAPSTSPKAATGLGQISSSNTLQNDQVFIKCCDSTHAYSLLFQCFFEFLSQFQNNSFFLF